MEKKEIQKWRDRLIKMFGIYHSDGQEYVTCPLCGINLDELAKHMIEELDRAREEGRREVYEAIVFDKNIPHDVTTFVAAHLWKNMRDKAKEELSKLKDNK